MAVKKKPSPSRPTALVALLRGINVGGNRKVPMEELRALATGLGYERVETYIASGNLLFATDRAAEVVAGELERAIADHFGFEVPVIVRSAAEWAIYAAGSPFPEAAEARAKMLHLGLSRKPPAAGFVERVQPAAKAGERVVVLGDAIWIDFVEGVAGSKFTPALLDRAAGSPVTARNWRTVLELHARLKALDG